MRTSMTEWIMLAVVPAAVFMLPTQDSAPESTERSAPIATLVVSKLEHAPPTQHWFPPLGWTLEVSRPFDAPAHRYAAGHRGFDLEAVPGEAVNAPAAGTVTFAGRVVDRDVVSIRIDEVTVVSLEPVTSDVAAGASVARGEPLGRVSRGGHCDDSCVHLGVRVDDWYVNPMSFFREKPRLLPWD